MREILFRGQTRKYGQKVNMAGEKLPGIWVYGGIFPGTGDHSIIYGGPKQSGLDIEKHVVYSETVGQFTGLTDKNGKKIFEGDVIKSDNGKQSAISVVKFGEYYPQMFYKMLDMYCPGRRHMLAKGFYAESVDKHEDMILFQTPCVEVIGNIHDNPELLEVDHV